MSESRAESRWYVMLFPSEAETATLGAALRKLTDRVRGVPNPTPHVTIGYFHGTAAPDAVIVQIRPLVGPCVRIHASGLFSWSEEPHSLFGYTLSLRVCRDGPMEAWQRAVRVAIAPTGLTPTFTWEHQQPHMNVVRAMPMPPRDALKLLPDREYPLSWTATLLVVSQEMGGEFPRLLEQSLRDDPSPARP
jgi:hypothetical protein